MAEPRIRYGRIGSPEGVALEDETGAEVLRVAGGAASGRVLDRGGRQVDIRTAIEDEHGSAAFGTPGFDVTEGVRLAFNRAVSRGVPLYIPRNPADPSGLWSVRGIEVSSQIEIFGEGGLVALPTMETPMGLLALAGDDSIVRGVTLHVNSTNLPGSFSGRGAGLYISGARTRIDGVTSRDTPDELGYNFEIHAPDCVLRGCRALNAGSSSLRIYGGAFSETVVDGFESIGLRRKGVSIGGSNRKVVIRNSRLQAEASDPASDFILGETGAGHLLGHLILEDVWLEGYVQSNIIKTVNATKFTARRLTAHAHPSVGTRTVYRSQHQYLEDPISGGVRTEVLLEECEFTGRLTFEGRERVVRLRDVTVDGPNDIAFPAIEMKGRRLVLEGCRLSSNWRGITVNPQYPARDGEGAGILDVEINGIEWRGSDDSVPLTGGSTEGVTWTARDVRVISGHSVLVDESYRNEPVVRLTELGVLANRYSANDFTHIPGVHVGTSSGDTVHIALGSIARNGDHLSFEGTRNMGVFVDTRTYKKFVVKRDHYGGSSTVVWVICYDANGNALVGEDPWYATNHQQRGVALISSTNMGGCYRTATRTPEDVYFAVHEDVKRVRISTGFGDLNGWSIDALVRDNAQEARGSVEYWTGLDVPVPGAGVATSPPPAEEHADGRLIYHASPTVQGSAGSQYVVEGWQKIAGTWVERRYFTGS